MKKKKQECLLLIMRNGLQTFDLCKIFENKNILFKKCLQTSKQHAYLPSVQRIGIVLLSMLLLSKGNLFLFPESRYKYDSYQRCMGVCIVPNGKRIYLNGFLSLNGLYH